MDTDMLSRVVAAAGLTLAAFGCAADPVATEDPDPEPPQCTLTGCQLSAMTCSTNEFGFAECLIPGARLVGGGVWSPTFVRNETWVIYERDEQAGGSQFWLTALDGSGDAPLRWMGQRAYAGPGDPPIWGVAGTAVSALDPWTGATRTVVTLPTGFSVAAPEGRFTVAARNDGSILAIDLDVGTSTPVASPILGARPHRLLATQDGRIFVNTEDRDSAGNRPAFLIAINGSASGCPDYLHPFAADDGWVYGFPPGSLLLKRSRCDGSEETVYGPIPQQNQGVHVSVAGERLAISLAETAVLGDGRIIARHSAASGRDAARLSPSGGKVAINSSEGLKIVFLP